VRWWRAGTRRCRPPVGCVTLKKSLSRCAACVSSLTSGAHVCSVWASSRTGPVPHSLAACHAAQAHRMGCRLTQTWLLAFGSAGSNWNVLIIYDGSVRLYALSHIDIIPHPVRFLCLHDKSITSCYRPAKQTHAAQPALELLSDNASPCRR
jgi:hypothetical protein